MKVVAPEPRTGTRGGRELSEVLSYLLDPRTGAVLSLRTDLPEIRAVRGSTVVTTQTDPFPQVAVRTLTIRR